MQPRTIRPHSSSILNKGGNRLQDAANHTDSLSCGGSLGAQQRAIESEGVAADYTQFEKNETSVQTSSVHAVPAAGASAGYSVVFVRAA